MMKTLNAEKKINYKELKELCDKAGWDVEDIVDEGFEELEFTCDDLFGEDWPDSFYEAVYGGRWLITGDYNLTNYKIGVDIYYYQYAEAHWYVDYHMRDGVKDKWNLRSQHCSSEKAAQAIVQQFKAEFEAAA